MNEVLLGATLPQFTGDRERFTDAVRAAEEAGLDSIWVFDHMWPLTGKKARPVLECWTSLAWIAGATEKIGIGTLVTRSSLRHPAVLAKMAATVAEIAPGRLTVTIGSGDELSRDENEAFGLPYWAAEERARQLASTVEVVADFFEWGRVDRTDDFATITNLPPSPSGRPRPAIWVGGRSDDVIDVAARRADGWNGWGGTPDRFAQDAQRVLDLAEGRAIEMSWAGLAAVGETDDAASRQLGDRNPRGWLWGGPERAAEQLRGFVEAGARHVVVTLPDAGAEGVFEVLATRIRPLLQPD